MSNHTEIIVIFCVPGSAGADGWSEKQFESFKLFKRFKLIERYIVSIRHTTVLVSFVEKHGNKYFDLQ